MVGAPPEPAGTPRRSALVSVGSVVGGAGRLLLRHWPVLLALSFAGLAARAALSTAAVKVSKIDGVLGYLVVVLVPVATMVALVLMLVAMRTSLPTARGAGPGLPSLGSRTRSILDHLGSILIPFLIVYAYTGYLREDMSEYVYGVLEAEVFTDNTLIDPGRVDVASRLPFRVTAWLLTVVAVAALLRFALGRWEGAVRRRWLGIIGAYLEIIWITLAAAFLLNQTKAWLTSRRVVQWIEDAVDRALEPLGSFASVANGALHWCYQLAVDATVVIGVPLAWLTVGAVVYGHRLAPPALSASRPIADGWRRVPGPIRSLALAVSGSLRERFGPMVFGLRLLFHTNLRPMLLFCLVFLVVQATSEWLWQLQRLLIGPRDLATVWVPLSGLLSVVNDAVRATVLVCLVAAAVEFVLRSSPLIAARAAEHTEADPPAR
jgi:hypothetical protein